MDPNIVLQCQENLPEYDNMFSLACLQHEKVLERVLNYSYLTISIALMILCVNLLKQSKNKIKQISEPNIAHPWDKTFCILSLYMVKVVQIMLILLITNQFFFIFSFASGFTYLFQKMWIGENPCKHKKWYQIHNVSTLILDTIKSSLFYLMIFVFIL